MVQHVGQSLHEVLQSQVLRYLLHQVLQTLRRVDIVVNHCRRRPGACQPCAMKAPSRPSIESLGELVYAGSEAPEL